ncbi:MAG TPA: DUF1275 family protein [Dyella sp.]|nr:DUF1275 family protein [Dyella sp.]
MKSPSLPSLLGFNAGYVDTAGFLALHGLFTAHVTGNFVTLGAALVQGSGGAIAKLLALPVFCVVIVVARLFHYVLLGRGMPVLRTILLLKTLLLLLGATLAWCFGPFATGDSVYAVATGLVLVAAMAVQNAAQRVHLAKMPPTTMMTGNTTQIMLDVADRLRGVQGDEQAATNQRLWRMAASIGVFALGCASGAVFYRLFDVKCFALLPLVALMAYRHRDAAAAA